MHVTNPQPGSLRIRVFGSFEAAVDDKPVEPHRPPDMRALAYLILNHDVPVDRTDLAVQVWNKGERTQWIKRALEYASKAVYELRLRVNVGHEHISKPTTQMVLFDTTSVDLDLLEYEALIADGGVEAMERAAGTLCSRTLLDGWDDAWVLEARTRIRLEFLASLKDAALRARDQAEWDNAIRYYTLAHDVDPAQECFLRDLLQILCERRKFSAMAQVYDSFLAWSAREGLEVDPEARSAYRTLRGDADHFIASAENGLIPKPISTFIPRPKDLEEICSLVHSGRLTTLAGPGGVGKTRLSIAAAERLNDAFFDRAWFVDLSEVSDPVGIPLKIGKCLHADVRPDESSAEALVRLLLHKDLLLVLDNCEHLIDGCASTAARVLESCGGVRILATSREPLDIVGETVWRVPSMAVPKDEGAISLETLNSFNSVQLLTERASRPQIPFQVDAENSDAISRIVRRLDGIPLAIELAAVQIDRRRFSPQQTADSLDNSLAFLSEGSRTAPPRHQTLRATIAWSYDLLGQPEKIVFKRLAVFAGGFTEEAVRRVCSDDSICQDQTAAALQALVEKSLVEERTANEGIKRFHLLQTIHEYAAEKLRSTSDGVELSDEPAAGDAGLVRLLHLDYFRTLVESAAPNLSGPEQVKLLDILSEEHENVSTALAWAYDCGEFELGLRLAGAIAWFWNTRDHRRLGARWLDRFLEKTVKDLTEHRLTALHWAGNIAYGSADYARARDLYMEALETRKSVSPSSVATGQASIANALAGLGEYDQAMAHFEASLRTFRENSDSRNVALTLINIGKLAYQCGDPKRAAELFNESLPLLGEVEDIENEAVATNNLIDALITVGDFEMAQRILPRSLKLCVELKSERRITNCLLNCLMLATHERDWERGAIIHGFVSVLQKHIEYTLPADAQAAYDADCELICKGLGEMQYQELVSQGERMALPALVKRLTGE